MNRPIRLDSLDSLSDSTLIRQLETIRGRERKVLAAVLRHLTEIERRRLYLPRGYSSLFEFCTQHLKYSRSAAGRRIASARTIARFSSLEGYLLSGEINLYSLSLVSGILTVDNLERVVRGIRNRPTREVEALVAGFRPGRVLKDRVRAVSVMVPASGEERDNSRGAVRGDVRSCAPGPAGNNGPAGADPGTGASANPPGGPAPAPPGTVSTPGAGSDFSVPGSGRGLFDTSTPGTASGAPHGDGFERVRISRKYKFEFAVDGGFMYKFERLKSLLSGRYPEGMTFEELFLLLMDEYIDRHSPEGKAARREKRRTGKRSKEEASEDRAAVRQAAVPGGGAARPEGWTAVKRRIPARVRDEVYLRDGGRCTFRGSDGRRCNSTWDLQIDHIVPFALGGDDSPANLRLLCGKHNRLEAERVFGSRRMERFRKKE